MELVSIIFFKFQILSRVVSKDNSLVLLYAGNQISPFVDFRSESNVMLGVCKGATKADARILHKPSWRPCVLPSRLDTSRMFS